MTVRHFLTLLDCTPDELRRLITRGAELKAMQHRGEIHEPLKNKTLAIIFEKSSTRTRVSFEVGMAQFGGHALFLSPRDTHFGRGESIKDAARVLSRMVDGIMIRTYEHEKAQRLAKYSQVPVINGLTDMFHPCQLLADMQTFFEQRGDIKSGAVAWIGDGNNMCNSYINAARQFEFELRIACPKGYEPNPEVMEAAGNRVAIVREPTEAARGADLVVTDVWASMGQEQEQARRVRAFGRYQVNEVVMAQARKDALFMHCLPAHRGEEVAETVLEGPQSVVWEEAENRLHAQKALMEFLLA
jgi:ornithine carbamoyltransferase